MDKQPSQGQGEGSSSPTHAEARAAAAGADSSNNTSVPHGNSASVTSDNATRANRGHFAQANNSVSPGVGHGGAGSGGVAHNSSFSNISGNANHPSSSAAGRGHHNQPRHSQEHGGQGNANRQRGRTHQQYNSPSPPNLEDDIRSTAQANIATGNSAQSQGMPLPISSVPQPGQQQALPNDAPYNWQSSRTTVKERLLFMFNNEVMADVHFLVGKGPHVQCIPAHKFVLSISSAVFDAMFNGGMASTSEEVEIPDVEPAAFLALLRFLYTDEVQIGPETVMTTLYTAKKYAVPALERACVEFLKRNLCSENAFMLLTQARLFDEPQLAALCLETIDKNTSEALSAEGFTDIDLDTLCVVLERDTLGIRECKLFGAVCRWAGAESQRQNLPVTSENQREVLGRALPLIRFPLMTVEEFAVGAAQSGILTDREVVELFLHFTVNPKPAVNFLDTPRCCLTGKEQVVARFCQIESRWGYSGTSDRIRWVSFHIKMTKRIY